MAYVRKKNIQGKDYFYLVECVNGLQKNLKYLGKELNDEYKALWHKRKRKN